MQEFDGSDSGARPDEAKSWGKIRYDASLSCAVVQEIFSSWPTTSHRSGRNLSCFANANPSPTATKSHSHSRQSFSWRVSFIRLSAPTTCNFRTAVYPESKPKRGNDLCLLVHVPPENPSQYGIRTPKEFLLNSGCSMQSHVTFGFALNNVVNVDA